MGCLGCVGWLWVDGGQDAGQECGQVGAFLGGEGGQESGFAFELVGEEGVDELFALGGEADEGFAAVAFDAGTGEESELFEAGEAFGGGGAGGEGFAGEVAWA